MRLRKFETLDNKYIFLDADKIEGVALGTDYNETYTKIFVTASDEPYIVKGTMEEAYKILMGPDNIYEEIIK